MQPLLTQQTSPRKTLDSSNSDLKGRFYAKINKNCKLSFKFEDNEYKNMIMIGKMSILVIN